LRSEPAKRTTEEEIKLVPLRVIVKPEEPTVLEEGSMEVRVGTGLLELGMVTEIVESARSWAKQKRGKEKISKVRMISKKNLFI